MTKVFQVRLLIMSLMIGDWTPFVPAMGPFLQLKSMEDVSMKRETIVLSDIELVTDRMIKVSDLDDVQ